MRPDNERKGTTERARKGPNNASGGGARAGVRPESYTVETDDGPELRAELVDEEAREEARRCEGVSDSQMRRFFGAAKAEQTGMTTDNHAKVAMALLKAKAHYAAGRPGGNKVLAELFGHHARLVSTRAQFEQFMQHFEAVIAYHKFFRKQDPT